MRLYAVLTAAALLLPPSVYALQQDAAANASSPSAPLQLNQVTEAPGLSLARGSYSIRIADRLQDRLIVQIQKSGSQGATSLLAYPNANLRNAGIGPIIFASGLKGKSTLRGYSFPGGPVVEFVFPKADAVDLAKNNNVRVMAVDTASEGKVELPNLTQTDLSEVTLWMLTPTPVDPTTAKPGIQAARYQPPVAAPTPTPLSASAEAPSAQPSSSPSTARTTPSRSSSAPILVAGNARPAHLRPNVKQLPHTASNVPLVGLVGISALFGASLLTLRRRLVGR